MRRRRTPPPLIIAAAFAAGIATATSVPRTVAADVAAAATATQRSSRIGRRSTRVVPCPCRPVAGLVPILPLLLLLLPLLYLLVRLTMILPSGLGSILLRPTVQGRSCLPRGCGQRNLLL